MDDRAVLGTEVTLPSRGLLYDGKLPGGKVLVVPMTTREEKAVTGTLPQNAIPALNTVIGRVCPTLGEAGVKPEDLVSGDRFYLMIVMRAVAYGGDYNFQVTCDSCGQQQPHTVKLPDDVSVIWLKDGYTEPVEIQLPMSKTTVGIRMLRGSDEQEIAKYAEKVFATAKGVVENDPVYTFRMARHITHVTGPTTNILPGEPDVIQRAMVFLDGLYAGDARVLREAIDDNYCGVDTEMRLVCIRCRNAFAMAMPYTADFFRPGGRRGL